MIVYGVTNEDKGIVLFDGNIDDCRDFVKDNEELDLTNYYSVNICRDNGEIVERIKTSRPAYQSLI